ncbi:centrosomal protein of 55 kDa isoform X2 [Electrophorus electricus]|uniref:Centrosomal protein of 55 kDa n=1 Tax=Electrophorus electricus TaxID=8005 RepID=A0AAY5EJS9_ELEEL|nr:centrosomal protein of 55 kDa isoform X2 [Electrophorus electricus]
MATKGAKEMIVNKLGFKSSTPKSVEAELEKVKKENTQLKKNLDEMSKQKLRSPCPDSDKSKLMERIVSLEMLRERNSQQLLAKDQEISSLSRQLAAKGGEVVVSLQKQLEQSRKEAEQREKLFQALSQETEDLKNKLAAAAKRCQTLGKHVTDVQAPSGEVAVIQEHLRDALEKNQHWLVYDQQRETYVQGILARITELEQQLNQAKQALHQPHKDGSLEGPLSPTAQRNPDEFLKVAQQELEEERVQGFRVRAELNELRAKYEERTREMIRTQEELKEERQNSRQALGEERKLATERAARLQSEMEVASARLEEERKRVTEMMSQVNLLQKSLLNQHEEQKKIAVLEKQIQLSTKDFENEKLDRQSLQHQLHKVLKELRKARDQITRLESTKQQRETRFSEPSSYEKLDRGRLTIHDHILNPTSPMKGPGTLDESILECPNCRALYPTSQHRELLAHLDYCFN